MYGSSLLDSVLGVDEVDRDGSPGHLGASRGGRWRRSAAMAAAAVGDPRDVGRGDSAEGGPAAQAGGQ